MSVKQNLTVDAEVRQAPLSERIARTLWECDQDSVETPFDDLQCGPALETLLDTVDKVMEVIAPNEIAGAADRWQKAYLIAHDQASENGAEANRLRGALTEIETFGYANSGHGFSCARMASVALGKEPRSADKWERKT